MTFVRWKKGIVVGRSLLSHVANSRCAVSIFLSAKKEKVTQNNEEVEKIFFWLEFVDRDLQPTYVAQRGIDMQKIPPEGISAEEVVDLVVAAGSMAMQIGLAILFSSEG